ncbi:MAG: hypothetical protein K2J14_06545, partial [Treponemataceae bacterium]|nr:hypothetical protein [Treponemataceae bacterium]
ISVGLVGWFLFILYCIETTPKPYSPATEDSWTITSDFYSKIQTPPDGTTDKDGNFVVKGTSDVLTATFYKSGVAGHGKTTTSNKVSYGGYGSWSKTEITGGKIKNDCLKIADVKGAVTLTIKWALNGAATDSRTLQVTVGDEGKSVDTKCNGTKGAQTDYVVNFDAGAGTNVYIGASNEICIVSVTIEAQK